MIADASDMNDNFYEVGSGSIFPKGGSYLEPTDGVYNLGSSTYKWKDGYFTNVYANNLTISGTITTAKTWRRISTVILTAGASKIEFTGLSGQTYKQIMINGVICHSTGAFVYINGDSSTNNYKVSNIQCYSGGWNVSAYLSNTGFYTWDSATSAWDFSVGYPVSMLFDVSQNTYEGIQVNTLSGGGYTYTTIAPARMTGSYYVLSIGAASSVTSIQIVGTMGAGTYLQMWATYL